MNKTAMEIGGKCYSKQPLVKPKKSKAMSFYLKQFWVCEDCEKRFDSEDETFGHECDPKEVVLVNERYDETKRLMEQNKLDETIKICKKQNKVLKELVKLEVD